MTRINDTGIVQGVNPPTLKVQDIWPTHGAIRGGRTIAQNVPLGASGYVVPKRFAVSFEDPELPYDVELEIVVDETRGPRCREFTARARFDGPEVSTADLRQLPIASLVQQAARFMAYEQIVTDDETVTLRPAKLDEQTRQRVQEAWGRARATTRTRGTFPPTRSNLTLVGELVNDELRLAKEEDRRPEVYARVRDWLQKRGFDVSRATVQRRIERAQETGLAPEWVENKKGDR